MDLIVDVLLEVVSIVLMGCICFIIYVYGKIFLIKIGLINPKQEDGTDWKLNGKLIKGELSLKYVKG